MSDTVLNVQSLTAGYVPGLPILKDVNMCLGRGEIVAVIGPNGAGKSTLIKAIAGLVLVEEGTIMLGARNLVGIRPDEMAIFGIAYVPQTNNIFRTLTIRQNLMLAAKRSDGLVDDLIERMFTLFEILRGKQMDKGGKLSGGQRQMLAIAMALVAEPKLILMDEPTAGLAPKVAEEILSLVQDIAEKGVSVIFVEQNVKAALSISNRTYVLAEGRNQIDGSTQELMEGQVIKEIYLGDRRIET
jgi:ABC-type branched-subunit amino acid transport system ATPase component